MKFLNTLVVLFNLFGALRIALFPTLLAVLRRPQLVFQRRALSQLFMSHVWVPFGDGMNEGLRPIKQSLITPHARGTVLDIGAGHGHTVDFLDLSKVTKYVALEPNPLMHTRIRARAAQHGLTEDAGTLLILPYGAEHVSLIRSALPDGVDTMISVLALCSVPPAEGRGPLSALVLQVLNPGGEFLFHEHVLSAHADVAWWQRFWTPVSKFMFDGCRLDRPTHEDLRTMKGPDGRESVWSEGESRGDEDEYHLFWKHTGRYVKLR